MRFAYERTLPDAIFGAREMIQRSPPATAAEIVAIVGPLDDVALMRIVETGASAGEVLEFMKS